jgi:hypothetical protein
MLAASSPSRNAFMIVECGAQPVELNMAQESAIKMTERTHFKFVYFRLTATIKWTRKVGKPRNDGGNIIELTSWKHFSIFSWGTPYKTMHFSWGVDTLRITSNTGPAVPAV